MSRHLLTFNLSR